jgi:hypothetical protein
MDNNNRGKENSSPENYHSRESNNDMQSPMGFEGMNFEQQRGRFGDNVDINRMIGQNERNYSDDRQDL